MPPGGSPGEPVHAAEWSANVSASLAHPRAASCATTPNDSMHAAPSLSRPPPPPVPIRDRHPLDVDPLDFRRHLPRATPVVSAIGDPPPSLAAAHRPAVVNAVLETVRGHMRDPVRTVAGTRLPALELRGVLRFHTHESGEVTVVRHERWSWQPTKRVEVCSSELDLDRPLSDAAWTEAIRRELLCTVFSADVAHPAPIYDYVEWAVTAMRDRLVRDGDWRELDDGIAEDLGLEPYYVAIARVIPVGPVTPAASLAAYNHVVLHAAEYEQLVDDNDSLIPLYAACREAQDFPATGEPLERLRGFLSAKGLSSALWRRIAAPGRGGHYVSPAFVDPEFPLASALDVLAIVDALGPEHDPPVWLTEALFAHGIGPYGEVTGDPTGARWAAARRIAVLHQRADPGQREAMREMIGLVIAWITGDDRIPSVATIRSAGWHWFARRARIHRERQETASIRSPVPFERLEIDGHVVIALANGLALWDEGDQMRHCAHRYAPECARGALLICSVRSRGDPRSRWTAAFERLPQGWRLDKLAGRMNAAPSPAAQRIAEAIEAWLNEHAAPDLTSA